MSKAEERALEKYPYAEICREKYLEGYHQAEKDLELTWEDIETILNVENDLLHECNSQKELVIKTYPKGEDYYGEILKRFKERNK
jgi:hypothetical protein